MEINEQAIISACQQGELEQFGLLYDFYFKKIYSFVFYRVKEKETAEDLTSQVFFKALNAISKFKSEKGSFSSWIYRIARNAVIDHYRTKKSESNLSDAINMTEDYSQIERLAIKEQIVKAEEYLKKLKPEQRDIITMRLWDELSYKEIAEVTGKSEASCKMLFMRTIGKMRQEILAAIILISMLIK